jgi:hypothetical protein
MNTYTAPTHLSQSKQRWTACGSQPYLASRFVKVTRPSFLWLRCGLILATAMGANQCAEWANQQCAPK